MIGLLGGLRFRVNDSRVLTFQNMRREISASWNTMNRIGQKPLSEFGGADLQTVTFDITLDASLGVKPRMLLGIMERMTESGEANELVIGRQLVGKNKWVITKCSQAWEIILRGGELYRANVTLTLQEYL
ncbi:MAG TPA: DNA-packaging protein [Lachnoclostridium sp.]|jgi:phage protein U|uniref:phage tail protein n=1 Tax=Lacrimispora sp. TaxID=2719234 RepID=UPI000EC9D248|nr:phage tail protein [Lacrimispora sp.]HCD43978.1 DNA-packaging protein [Lachnoclostridium sp.]